MSAHALSTPVRTVCAGAASWASEAASIVWPKARPKSFAGVQQLSAVHPLSGREWTEDGQLWVQYVSSTPATRLDVINLQEQLDQRLLQRQARETGICPVREELYAQCFDELIRQVTINCAERYCHSVPHDLSYSSLLTPFRFCFFTKEVCCCCA